MVRPALTCPDTIGVSPIKWWLSGFFVLPMWDWLRVAETLWQPAVSLCHTCCPGEAQQYIVWLIVYISVLFAHPYIVHRPLKQCIPRTLATHTVYTSYIGHSNSVHLVHWPPKQCLPRTFATQTVYTSYIGHPNSVHWPPKQCLPRTLDTHTLYNRYSNSVYLIH